MPAIRVVYDDGFDQMNTKMMKRKIQEQACGRIELARSWRLLLLVAWAMFGVVAARAQTVYVGVETKSVDGSAKPAVKVWIGKYSATTNEAGGAALEIPAGTYTARAETKCRVVKASASSNLMPGRQSTELVLTVTVPQDLPSGILFELDCSNLKKSGKTKPKTTAKKGS